MELSTALKKAYTEERLSARDAQRLAEFIAWSPMVFQASRLMVKWGILQLIHDAGDKGLTRQEICQSTGLSDYAVKCLTEASLCIGTILVEPETGRFRLSKAGWFLLNDQAVGVNMDFCHDVNYEGLFCLEEALKEGKPAGLRHLGPWPTIYEGLSSLPEQVRQSWLSFDHFYSDAAFAEALEIVFGQHHVRTLYDIGGNTGRWALLCVDYDKDVEVTILDLPQQIAMMQAHISGKPGAERIKGYAINLLDAGARLPKSEREPDAIWMSQFLDCFAMDEIVGILKRTKEVMTAGTRLYIMETLWDRQHFDTAAFCLTMTSLYFTAMANGNSKMYSTEDMEACIHEAGLEIEQIYDHLGQGHSVLVVKMKNEDLKMKNEEFSTALEREK